MKPRTAAGVVLFSMVLLGYAVAASGVRVPKFEHDPYWPKPLPNNWMLGIVSSVDVDSHDHIWVLHRPRSLADTDKLAADGQSDCCVPAPPVLEYDQAGNVIQAWGGPGPGYDWPEHEHGVFIDYKENVWIAGNGNMDSNILKFTKSGKFIMQIGSHGKPGGNNDTRNFNKPAGITVYPPTNEVFVADGYGNRRVIVLDADTGAYKRQWGAYGNKPDDAAPRNRTFEGPGDANFNLVHAIRISNDGLAYVADRVNNRVQIFRLDGTFVQEVFLERKTSAKEGSAFGVAFSPDKDQQFFYVPDGSNKKVHIVNRKSLEVVGYFGGHGGHGYGEFAHIHSIAADSKGNLYLGESTNGNRAVRWNFKGMAGQ